MVSPKTVQYTRVKARESPAARKEDRVAAGGGLVVAMLSSGSSATN